MSAAENRKEKLRWSFRDHGHEWLVSNQIGGFYVLKYLVDREDVEKMVETLNSEL